MMVCVTAQDGQDAAMYPALFVCVSMRDIDGQDEGDGKKET